MCAWSDILLHDDGDFADTELNDDLHGNPIPDFFCGRVGGEEEQDMNSGNNEDDNDDLCDWEREAFNALNGQTKNEKEVTNASTKQICEWESSHCISIAWNEEVLLSWSAYILFRCWPETQLFE